MPRSLAIALAACSFALPAGSDTRIQIQLTPAGEFRPSDGREMKVDAWRIDQAIATRVIDRFRARANPAVIDYEHQTLHKETNGQPAPAAAWIHDLEWRDGAGLFGTVELTSRLRQAINDGEYKFISPVFSYDRRTGDVLDLQMAAVTNNPAIDGMEPLALQAAATFGIHTFEEDPSMNPLLKAILAALSLPDTTTEQDAIAALTARLDPAKTVDVDKIRAALGIAASDDLVAACTSLKTKAEAPADPTKYVSLAAFEEVKTALAALTKQSVTSQVDQLITEGLADGRLLKAQEGWARELGGKDIAALTAYLKDTPPIAALSSTQTAGRRGPAQTNADGLTEEELAVCSATGTDPKDFIAARPT
ncbi:MAG: phage protease [Luteibacter sp.]